MHTGTRSTERRTATGARLAAALASVTFLATGPAQARIETPLDTGGRAGANVDSGMSDVVASGKVTPTRVTGLYGVKVDGGWLLR